MPNCLSSSRPSSGLRAVVTIVMFIPCWKASVSMLTSGKTVSFFRQGGNAQFYFYGLRTGGQFRTLLEFKNPPPGPPFLSFGTFRATK